MATNSERCRWVVECDGEQIPCRTRKGARALAKRMTAHPSNQDIQQFGPYSNVDGIARVVDRGLPEAAA